MQYLLGIQTVLFYLFDVALITKYSITTAFNLCRLPNCRLAGLIFEHFLSLVFFILVVWSLHPNTHLTLFVFYYILCFCGC